MCSISINDVLSQDLLARNSQEVREEDLIPLDTLSRKKWDYSAPTFISDYASRSKVLINDSSVVISAFLEKYPCFVGVDMSHILVAGGAVSLAICDNSESSDADLFIYGLNSSQVHSRIHCLVMELKLPTEGTIKKTKFSTTIIYMLGDRKVKIQIIHRVYNTPSEVLHGFDMGSCSVGILLNEKKVVTTSLGRVSLEYKINILDLSKRSLNYEDRLMKYADRGFSIVMPDYNVKKTIYGTYFTLYRFDIKVLVKKSATSRNPNKMECNICPTGKVTDSDYDEIFDHSDAIHRCNTIKLYKGIDLIYCKEWSGLGELIECLHDSIVTIDVPKDLCKATFRGMFRYKAVMYYLGYSAAKYFIEEVMNCETDEELEYTEKEIYECFSKEVLKRLKAYNEKGGYRAEWVIVNPASQITGSFHPAVVTKEEFYGIFLKE